MLGTKGVNLAIQPSGNRFPEIHSVEGLPADLAQDQLHVGHIFPLSVQKGFKLDSGLRTYSPAISASGTKAHVVHDLPSLFTVLVFQCAGRAILNACQASIAIAVYLEKGHNLSTLHILLHSMELLYCRLVSFQNRKVRLDRHVPHDLEMLSRRLPETRLVEFKTAHVGQCLGFADSHAFGFPVAEIALECQTPGSIKSHRPGRTGRDAHLATYAEVGPDHNPVELLVPVNGLIGTDIHTGRLFAVLAGHGKVEPLHTESADDIYAGAGRRALS
jgi:hypothetical protein